MKFRYEKILTGCDAPRYKYSFNFFEEFFSMPISLNDEITTEEMNDFFAFMENEVNEFAAKRFRTMPVFYGGEIEYRDSFRYEFKSSDFVVLPDFIGIIFTNEFKWIKK